MVQMTGICKHENRYVMIKIFNDITFVVKLLVAKKAFKETLNHNSRNNCKIPTIDLFRKEIIVLAKGIFLQNYICQIQKN